MAIEQKYFLYFLLFIFLALLAFLVFPFLTPILIGGIFAVTFYPLYKKFRTKFKNDNWAAILTTIIITLVLIAPLAFLLAGLTQEALVLFNKISTGEWQGRWQTIMSQKSFVSGWLDSLGSRIGLDIRGEFQNSLSSILKNLSLFLYEGINKFISNIPGFLLGLFILIFSVFYILRDGQKLKKALIQLSPLSEKDDLLIFSRLKEVSNAILYGNLLSAAAQGVLGGLGFFLFGLGSPILWGAIMILLALIPVLGPFLVFIPASVFLWFSAGPTLAVIFLLYNFLLVSGVDNFIRPFFIGGRIKIHPFLTLIAILGGLSVFGLAGVIYGPIILVMFLTLSSLFVKNNSHLHP